MSDGFSSLLTGTGVTFTTNLTSLNSNSYLLATFIIDASGSTASYLQSMKDMLKLMLTATKQYGTAANIIIRFVSFNTVVREIIPFTALDKFDLTQIDTLSCGGWTSLYDASIEALDSTVTFGESLSKQGYDVASNTYFFSDGGDNSSAANIMGYFDAKQKLATYLTEASTYQDFLIGLGTGTSLDEFAALSKFSSYVKLGSPQADPGVLLKAGGIVSQSLQLRSNRLQPKANVVPNAATAPSLSLI
jgi:hypothetical protein